MLTSNLSVALSCRIEFLLLRKMNRRLFARYKARAHRSMIVSGPLHTKRISEILEIDARNSKHVARNFGETTTCSRAISAITTLRIRQRGQIHTPLKYISLIGIVFLLCIFAAQRPVD